MLSEFDLAKRLWIVPAQRMKADAAHVVPLSDDVIAILEFPPPVQKGRSPVQHYVRREADQWIFKSKGSPRPGDAWLDHPGRRDRAVGDPRHPPHDEDRTVALPVPDLVRELVIAHTKPGLHKVYDQHAYESEKRHALDLWAARLRSIVERRRRTSCQSGRRGASALRERAILPWQIFPIRNVNRCPASSD